MRLARGWLGASAAVAALALLPAAAPKKAAAKRAVSAWVSTIRATPEGGVLIGNPAAKVKLLEYGAYTCPHCAKFEAEGVPALMRKYVAGGKVSYEFRGFPIHGASDVAMTLLAMCQPPAASWRLSQAMFRAQDQIVGGLMAIKPDEYERLKALPPEQGIKEYADLGGIDSFVARYGITKAKFEACLADPANNAKFEANAREAQDRYGLTGTPWFVINGVPAADTSDWATLEPQLAKALQ